MHRIPILNVYYLLCYAWRHVQERDTKRLARLAGLSTVRDLLGKVLASGVNHLARRGIDRGYVEQREDLAGVRGEVRSAYRRLDGVSRVRLKRNTFGQVQLGGQRRVYHHLLSVCRLLYRSSVVDEQTGCTAFRDFRRDKATRGRGSGTGKLHSNNLYQLLAYLRNRQATRPDGARHEGILLYPQVGGETLRAEVWLEGFRIQARTVDLDQDWRMIHEEMLEVVAGGGTSGARMTTPRYIT